MNERFVIEVSRVDSREDELQLRLPAGVSSARAAQVYELAPLSESEARRLADELLRDPALDQARVVRGGEPDARCGERLGDGWQRWTAGGVLRPALPQAQLIKDEPRSKRHARDFRTRNSLTEKRHYFRCKSFVLRGPRKLALCSKKSCSRRSRFAPKVATSEERFFRLSCCVSRRVAVLASRDETR